MTRKYATFTKEFKLEALRLAEDSELSIAQLTRNLGIRRNMIYKWRAEMGKNKDKAFKHTASESSKPSEKDNMAELIAENKRLKKALKLSQMEAEILKKAEAYFISIINRLYLLRMTSIVQIKYPVKWGNFTRSLFSLFFARSH